MNKITCFFPLSHIHAGVTLGNGVLGLSLWGEGRILNLSVGSSSLWDHRGGMSWKECQNFTRIREALEARDEAGLRKLFAVDPPERPGDPPRPSLVPLARIEITLPPGSRSDRIELTPERGLVRAFYRRGGVTRGIRVLLAQKDKGAFAFKAQEALGVRVRPAGELSGALRSAGFAGPEKFALGFVQTMPNDPAFGIAGAAEAGHEWRFRFAREADAASLRQLPRPEFRALAAENRTFWGEFWKRAPEISCSETAIEMLYRLGLFKFQSMTAADGCPAGLQGPWIEDDAFPPWSGDFHFNINVEMCYWPAWHSGLWANLMPMFRMVLGWRDQLRFNARCFVGIDDGYMMSHAVDDRGVCMGAFWTGCIDHACAAWVAQMMMDYVRYTGDTAFLKRDAFDFMRGAMRVYEAMLEEEGDALVLPVGVSPEYRGDRIDAWGVNASFQLAAIHRLAADLIEAAQMLGEKPAPAWREIQRKLPSATLEEGTPGKKELALWRGTLPEESHRHHSHLAALCPFNTIRPDDPAWADVLKNSQNRWVGMGMGRWAGWSMPWAVMLHNRFGNLDMAATLVEFWKRCYTNPGNGTLHDPQFGGVSLGLCGNNRLMQMDAGMGMVAAIADLFLYETGGTLYPLHGVPDSWKSFEVKRIRGTNGLLFAARRRNGVTTLTLSAEKAVHCRISVNGQVREINLAPGGHFQCRVQASVT